MNLIYFKIYTPPAVGSTEMASEAKITVPMLWKVLEQNCSMSVISATGFGCQNGIRTTTRLTMNALSCHQSQVTKAESWVAESGNEEKKKEGARS